MHGLAVVTKCLLRKPLRISPHGPEQTPLPPSPFSENAIRDACRGSPRPELRTAHTAAQRA
jgi:hypothetical protein